MKALEYAILGCRYRQDPMYVKYLKGRTVLDIGCGRGEFLARDRANYVGIDVDPANVGECHRRGLSAQVMTALSLSFPDERFEVVRAAQLIEHFSPPDAVQLLSEASRVLKPGGIVFLTTPGVRNVWNTFSHVRPYPPDAFRKLLASHTENYLRKDGLRLSLMWAGGSRFFFNSRILSYLFGLLDLLVAPSNPIGWTIVLRKDSSAMEDSRTE